MNTQARDLRGAAIGPVRWQLSCTRRRAILALQWCANLMHEYHIVRGEARTEVPMTAPTWPDGGPPGPLNAVLGVLSSSFLPSFLGAPVFWPSSARARTERPATGACMAHEMLSSLRDGRLLGCAGVWWGAAAAGWVAGCPETRRSCALTVALRLRDARQSVRHTSCAGS